MPVLETRPAETDAFERLLTLRSARSREAMDEALLHRAFQDAANMYGDLMHWTGETLLAHCLGVLESYMPFEPDDEGIVACLLHHSLDAKQWTLDDLEKEYGSNVRSIVSGVHLLSHVTMKNRRMSQENLRLMFLRVSDDIRVVLLILCDHSHKLQRLDALEPDAQRNLCRDVLQLFAPVAARLGIYSLKHQMEAMAFPIAYPTDASRIDEQLQQIHDRNGQFLKNAAVTLEGFLRDANIPARVEGREKSPYSIFQKLRTKTLGHVEDIYDLFAFRVIVDSEAACYQALGVLHRIGHPLAGRFKDYIAFPKPNGYQSLHTTLARLPGVPEGIFTEVQIRTEGMHREADLGIAAHWTYKQGGAAEHASRRAKLQRAFTVHQTMEDRKGVSFADRIFALTPKGDIIELPEGATPLDFAFNVHSILGLSFKAARVNGGIVPLTYKLENGDIVEILRHKDPHPTANWMTVLKTASAKSRLKRYLMEQDKPSYVLAGRAALNMELMRNHLPPLDPDLSILREVDGKHLTFAEREELLIKVGQKAVTMQSLLQQLDALKGVLHQRHSEERLPPTENHAVAKVEGNIPMPVKFARCCKPDEGIRSALTGIISRDGSVRVHRGTCKLTRNANPERKIGVRWVEARTGVQK
jgi:guanosine-3',5'-bis(diphosphate) 3'-pyrophosphohydrolase